MVSFKKARWLDRKVGKPICYLISLLRSIRRKKTINRESIRKVLIIKMYGIGSIILASPVLYNLKQNCPDCKIYFLTLSENRGLYEDSPYIDGSIFFDLSSIKSAFASCYVIAKWMRHHKFDVVFDFEIASRFTAILTFLSPGSIRVGYVPAGSGKDIFDITIPYNESIHITRVYLRALDYLGFSIFNERPLPLPLSEKERQKVNRFLEKNKIKNFIVFNPNTSELAFERLWPLEYYGELGKKLLKKYKETAIVLIGGPKDVQRVNVVQKNIRKYGRAFSTVNKLNIKETAFLLSKSRVFVSNDSGPLHMGVVADVPTIGLFGPETPVIFSPRGRKHIALMSHEICSPCITIYKDKIINCNKNVACMKNITVETVFKEVIRRYQPLRVRSTAKSKRIKINDRHLTKTPQAAYSPKIPHNVTTDVNKNLSL